MALAPAVLIAPTSATASVPAGSKTRVAPAVKATVIAEAALVASLVRVTKSPAAVAVGVVGPAGFTLTGPGTMPPVTAAPAVLARLAERMVSLVRKPVADCPSRGTAGRAARPAPVSASIGGAVRFAFFHGPGLVDNDLAIAYREPIHFFFGPVGLGVRAHLNEPEPLGTAS